MELSSVPSTLTPATPTCSNWNSAAAKPSGSGPIRSQPILVSSFSIQNRTSLPVIDSGPVGPMGAQWNAQVVFGAPSAGNYHLIVYEASDTRGGDYIRLAAVSGPCAEVWVGGGEVLGLGVRPR